MARQKKSKIVNVITWLLLLLLLLGCIGAVLHFAGVGKDDITDIVNPTFRVEYDGKVYKTDTKNVLAVPQSGQARFEIKNCKSCTIKVLPHVTTETDFTFTVNGQEKKYSEVEDLTAAFIQKNNVYGDYFIIDFDNDYSLESVLSRLFGTDNITVSESNISSSYRLVVTSQNSEIVEIILCFDIGVQKVELPESIVF